MKTLQRQVVQSVQMAYAKGTLSNLKTQWRNYYLFCAYFGLTPLPAELQTICCFVEFLARSMTYQVILNHLSAIRHLHEWSNHDCVILDHVVLKLMLRGVRRKYPHTPKQKLPITPEILLNVLERLDLSKPHDVALRAAFTINFFSFLRTSNMMPRSVRAFDPKKHLTRGKLIVKGEFLVVCITWSKTIQYFNRVLTIPLASIPGSLLCPVNAYKELCRHIPAEPDSPAFLLPAPQKVTLTREVYLAQLRRLLQQAGFRPDLYAGHSFRRGGATCAFRAAVDGELVKLQGDWKSQAYLRYLDINISQRAQVTTKMRDYILQELS